MSMRIDDTSVTRPRDVAVKIKSSRIYRTMGSRKIEIERLFSSIAAAHPRDAEVLLIKLQRRLREPKRAETTR